MAELSLQVSNIVALLTVLFIVVALVFTAIWFFKRACDLSDDDRLHLERAKLLFLGAVALGVLTLVGAKKERHYGKGLGFHIGATAGVTTPSGRSASLL